MPERVRAEILGGNQIVEAISYNLSRDVVLGEVNTAYAAELAVLARELRLPPDYVDEIAAFCLE